MSEILSAEQHDATVKRLIDACMEAPDEAAKQKAKDAVVRLVDHDEALRAERDRLSRLLEEARDIMAGLYEEIALAASLGLRDPNYGTLGRARAFLSSEGTT